MKEKRIKLNKPEPATLTDLGDRACRWPVGEDPAGHTLFCGCKVTGKNAYCKRHARKSSFKPDPTKKRVDYRMYRSARTL